MYNPDNPSATAFCRAFESAALELNLTPFAISVHGLDNIDHAITTRTRIACRKPRITRRSLTCYSPKAIARQAELERYRRYKKNRKRGIRCRLIAVAPRPPPRADGPSERGSGRGKPQSTA